MIRIHRTLWFSALILVTSSLAACSIGSTLEPEPPEPAPKPPRNVKPKELTSVGTRTPQALR
jgi:hypothetical protein